LIDWLILLIHCFVHLHFLAPPHSPPPPPPSRLQHVRDFFLTIYLTNSLLIFVLIKFFGPSIIFIYLDADYLTKDILIWLDVYLLQYLEETSQMSSIKFEHCVIIFVLV
jgi:hypothetical protein